MRRIVMGFVAATALMTATGAEAQEKRTSKDVMRSYGHSLDAELNGITMCSKNKLGSQTAATYKRAAALELSKIEAELSRGSAVWLLHEQLMQLKVFLTAS